jgi:hypothetical protein
MKPGIDKFFNKLSESKLLQLSKELAQNKVDGVVGSIRQILIDQYAVDPVYATTIIRNYVNDILSSRYVKLMELKKKLKNKRNESKES